jgi:competence protein ComEC
VSEWALTGALVSAVGGILAGDLLGPNAAWPVLGCGAVLMALALLRCRGGRRVVLVVTACLLLGVATEQRALDGIAHSPVSELVGHASGVRVVAHLADDPSATRYSVRVLVRVSSIAGQSAGGRTVLLDASGTQGTELRLLEAGDGVEAIGTVEPLDGFDAQYRWRHAVAKCRVTRITAFAPADRPLDRVANSLRGLVLRGARALPPREQALLRGFLLGDTRDLDPAVVDDFRLAGLSHLLAVSGANVAFVLALVAPFARRARLGVRLGLGLAVLLVFGTMTRWEPSVLRAIVMASIALLGAFLGRPVPARRGLLLAALVLVLADPFLLRSVGFLLSVGAAGGIVLLARPIALRLPGPRWLREPLSVTLAAELGVAPVLLSTFGTVPLVALPANLLAEPLVGPLTMWGLVAGMGGAALGTRAAALLQAPTGLLLRLTEVIAATAARAPFAVDARSAWAITAVVSAGSALLSIDRPRRLRVMSDRARAGYPGEQGAWPERPGPKGQEREG